MEPVFGFALYSAAVAVVWIVASKRGRPGWAFALACTIAAPILARVAYGASGGSGLAAGFTVFLAPVIALVTVLAMPTSEHAAMQSGAHGQFKKCPYCAESVRIEAVKCKHCGSDLSSSPSTPRAVISNEIGGGSPAPQRPPT